ncbi:roadblock/LC7 domain-containing protein [Streptomyces spectabilis]|uniref:roadblock/LC7 domain-containing protein n=1 Tax=Streptomyces spectabilis TaxID=68270 RepID=UPI0033D547E7
MRTPGSSAQTTKPEESAKPRRPDEASRPVRDEPAVHGLSSEARNLHWLLTNLVEEVSGILSVAVVSSDGLLLLSSDPARNAESRPAHRPTGPRGSSADLATIVSGLGSLTLGAAQLMDGGTVKQTVVAMAEGSLFVMAISDGSLLGVHATPDCDMTVVAYHMALFVGRAGHVLTPELRSELRQSMENA